MGSIRFKCECGKEFSVPETLAGKKGRCPGCGSLVIIPAKAPIPGDADRAAGSTGEAGASSPASGDPYGAPVSGAAVPHVPSAAAAGMIAPSHAPPGTPPYAGPYPPSPLYLPPYAPPGYSPPYPHAPAPVPGSPENEPRPHYVPSSLEVSVSGCIKEAWGVIKDSAGHFVAASFIYLPLVWGLVWLPYFIGWGIFAFLAPPFFAGMHYFCLKKLRGQTARPWELFRGFKVYGSSLGAFLLIHALPGLAFVPTIILSSAFSRPWFRMWPSPVAIFGVIGTVAALAVSITVMVGYSLTYFFIVDRGMGPWASMVSSWRMAWQEKWRILAILILAYLANVVGALLLAVGLCVTLPLSFVALASVYHRLSLAQYQRATAEVKAEPRDRMSHVPERERRPTDECAY